MTETINKNSVIAKVQFKNIIDEAWAEITKPELKDARKKVALSTFILCGFVFGFFVSVHMLIAGYQILLESGVSKIILQRIAGVVVVLGGFCAMRMTFRGCSGALRNLFWKKPEVKKNEVN